MNRERIFGMLVEALNNIIDDYIQTNGYLETIEYLLDIGLSQQVLIDLFNFDECDVRSVVKNKENKLLKTRLEDIDHKIESLLIEKAATLDKLNIDL